MSRRPTSPHSVIQQTRPDIREPRSTTHTHTHTGQLSHLLAPAYYTNNHTGHPASSLTLHQGKVTRSCMAGTAANTLREPERNPNSVTD